MMYMYIRIYISYNYVIYMLHYTYYIIIRHTSCDIYDNASITKWRGDLTRRMNMPLGEIRIPFRAIKDFCRLMKPIITEIRLASRLLASRRKSWPIIIHACPSAEPGLVITRNDTPPSVYAGIHRAC